MLGSTLIKLFLCLAMICVGILLFAPTHAQNHAAVMMKNSDADGDGRISRKEWKGPRVEGSALDTGQKELVTDSHSGYYLMLRNRNLSPNGPPNRHINPQCPNVMRLRR